MILIGMVGCLLIVVAARIALHEVCHRFDRDDNGPSITPYWLTFRSPEDVTFEEGKEAFQDRRARFATLEAAMDASDGINTRRKARGKPAYTAVHGSYGGEWVLGASGEEKPVGGRTDIVEGRSLGALYKGE